MENKRQTLPKHIAVIMDGNGRWATRRFLPRVAGHKRGVESARELIRNCINRKLQVLTLFAFSSENWNRPRAEIKVLMSLLQGFLVDEIEELHKEGVKLQIVGNLKELNAQLQDLIYRAHDLTKQNKGLQLNIAISYGGRWDIVQASKKIAELVQSGELDIKNISEKTFAKYLVLSNLPDPELLIRTSGEQRISNFLLWQGAYTEIFFTNTLWPDFSKDDLQQALNFYNNRQRRFGRVNENNNITETKEARVEYVHA